MAEFTVFYSWQSDLPRKLSRDIIQEATKQAISRLRVDATVEDSPRLDHDTQDVAGVPEIAGTIFKKIDQCGVFLADLSFVGETTSTDPQKAKKRTPNPNVLLELGYAAARVGWERMILVMNTEFGPPEELIFDLRHRRFLLVFRCSPSSKKDSATIQASLSSKIEEAIRATIQNEHAAVQDSISQLDEHALFWMKDAGHRDYFSVPLRSTMGDILGSQRLDASLIRLIDLKLLRCDVAHGGGLYAYHWTYFGKLVLRKLGRLMGR